MFSFTPKKEDKKASFRFQQNQALKNIPLTQAKEKQKMTEPSFLTANINSQAIL